MSSPLSSGSLPQITNQQHLKDSFMSEGEEKSVDCCCCDWLLKLLPTQEQVEDFIIAFKPNSMLALQIKFERNCRSKLPPVALTARRADIAAEKAKFKVRGPQKGDKEQAREVKIPPRLDFLERRSTSTLNYHAQNKDRSCGINDSNSPVGSTCSFNINSPASTLGLSPDSSTTSSTERKEDKPTADLKQVCDQ